MVATPTLGPNMFRMVPVQGGLDLEFAGSVITARVSPNQATPLIAGQAVKLDTAITGGVPAVVALAADTDSPIGFVARNLKDASDAANANFELALDGTVMWMTASAAITRGDKLQTVIASNKVATNAGTNPIVGWALDAAAGDGSVFRAYILAPAYAAAQNIATIAGLQAALDARPQVATVSATLAEINAGKVLIAGVTGKQITILDFVERVTGNFATGTAMVLESTNGTPVLVQTELVAALTNGAIVLPQASDTNETLGAGFAVALGVNDGLQVVKTGSAMTGGTKVDFQITYTQK